MIEDAVRRPVLARRLQPTESIASWFSRIAHMNGFSGHELASRMLGQTVHSITDRDLDVIAAHSVIAPLTALSHQSPEEVMLASLGAWSGNLTTEEWRSSAQGRWILARLVTSSQQRVGRWTQACPLCLADSSTPFFRTAWRLAFLTECPIHGVELLDSCPGCGSPLDFAARGKYASPATRPDDLARCPVCDIDWRACVAPPSSRCLLRRQRHWLRAIPRGWTVLGNRSLRLSLLLDGLYRLQRILRAREPGRQLLTNLARDRGWTVPALGARAPIEHLGVVQRRFIMRILDHLLTDWPHRFVASAKQSLLRWSDLVDERSCVLPYWLASVGRMHLDRTWYRVSEQEIASAAQFLKTRTSSLPRARVREWLGCSVQKPWLGLSSNSMDTPQQLNLIGIERQSDRAILTQSVVRHLASALRRYCVRMPARQAVERAIQLPLVEDLKPRRSPKRS